MATVYSLENPAFAAFIFYATLVILKMMVMSFYTVSFRFKKKVFANPEDTQGMKGARVVKDDDDVERVRRNHLNDLENIIPFVLVGTFYLATGPSLGVAIWHFRIFTVARFLHTICYQMPLPQPSRALSFATGFFVTVSMALQIITSTVS